MKTLHFHTTRGGRFNNSGYLKFEGFESLNDCQYILDEYFIVSDDKDEPILDENGKMQYHYNGDVCDFEINEDGTGRLNIDGDYNTHVFVSVDNLDSKQENCLIRNFKSGYYEGNDELKEILIERSLIDYEIELESDETFQTWGKDKKSHQEIEAIASENDIEIEVTYNEN